MSKKPTSPAPRVRNSEDKLYQACLDACIEGIENLPVNRRRRVSATLSPNNTTPAPTTTTTTFPTTSNIDNNILSELAITPPVPQESAHSLISPPATPKRASLPLPAHSTLLEARMNRAPLHGAPSRGQAHVPRGPSSGSQDAFSNQDSQGSLPAFGTQDARSNLAVQPAANIGKFKLKRNAVKIVAPPAASTPFRLAPDGSTTSMAGSSPISEPVKAKSREFDRSQPAKPAAKPDSPVVSPVPAPPKVEPAAPSVKEEPALDDLFARLNACAGSTPPPAVVTIKQESPARPEGDHFSFEGRRSAEFSLVAQDKEADVAKEATKTDEIKGSEESENIPQADLEQLYLRKAFEYVQSLPGNNVAVQTIKAVSTKLRSSYAPNTQLDVVELEKLKARYAFAILKYVNQTHKSSTKPITSEFIKKTLQDNDGNMFGLYANLAEEKYLSLDDIVGTVELCKTIMDVLPKAESTATSVPVAPKPTAPTTTSDSKAVSKDPIDNMKAWPTQEKRENPPAHRSCILKGVAGVKSINELQALVWGGRLESITMPLPGSDFAVVRFLTPEACDKYFTETENGIEVQGDKKAVIFVEKQPGPTSINDVMRNCTEGDASRCVRALDAEEDWSDMMLMKLARGKGLAKREVDRIKKGKTARGRYYIEFRFANIYHALNFKRQLTEDPDWEPCTISYATDPCETARGVHYKDEDEEGAGFFA